MSKGFQFKRFFIRHDHCAMKVNTDGILLGAVARIEHCTRILDLGTGTGLVAIMLAQRTAEDCQITALELESNAYLQAVENAKNSAWANRISVLQGDVMQQRFREKFDLIVSNPPYFSDSPAARNEQRDLARAFTEHTHSDWLNQAKNWLSPNGRITLILPVEAAQKLIAQSAEFGLYRIEQWQLFTKVGKAAKRMLVSFALQPETCEYKALSIYDHHNRYTAEFQALTRAFYLNF